MGRPVNKGTFGQGRVGGKPKGAENKTTKQARELFVATLESQVDHIKDAFDTVREKDPAKYLDLFSKYAKYFVPVKMDITTDWQQIETVTSFTIIANDKADKG